MRDGLHLGKVFGIKIMVDWSWTLIFLLVTWNLATALGRLHPAWSAPLSWSIGGFAALLFFGSVLVHELAHALVALAQGIPVRNITLFLFGGVANIQREPPSPRAEFLITIVGPLASFILGVLFLLLGSGIDGVVAAAASTTYLAGIGPLATVLIWLGSVNLLLAIFNLVPGFPLDGGRLLRAALWAATGNLRTATRWAALAGQLFAAVFVVAGVARLFGAQFPFFGGGVSGGIWLIFIGWFLNNAAAQSYRQVVLRDLLDGLPVARLVRGNVAVVAPDLPVSALVEERIIGTDERAFPVVQHGTLVGLVCLEDVRRVPRAAWDTTTVRQIMTQADQLVVASPKDDLTDALDKLVQRNVSQVPVMEDGRLVGMLRRRDIVRWIELQGDPAMA